MFNIDGGSLSEFLSTPVVLPATLAGALAALFAVLALVAWRRTRATGAGRALLRFGALVIGVLAVVALIDRMGLNEQAAERRALMAREAELSRAALAPGSPLSCLDAGAGEIVENACEKAVFADARSTAAAVAYIAARLDLLRDAVALARQGGPDVLAEFAGSRRAIELDRFGLAAHVLANRDGCTADNCAAFAMLSDTNALKSNLKARVFDQYVARHAPNWRASPAAPPEPAVSQAPAAPAAPATASAEPAPGHVPLSPQYDFPSADSIPPVSIMNAEPPLPKDAGTGTDASAQAAGRDSAATPPTPPSKPAQVRTQPPPTR